MRSNPPQFEQTPPAAPAFSREVLLRKRPGELGLRIEGTRLEHLIERLHGELEQKGLLFKPAVYLSDEWGCPDGVPIIGVPFYLASEQLTRLEDEIMEGVEAETDEEIMRYLRHEAGHAYNYAYRLHEDPEWAALFGPFDRPYPDDYTPDPFSIRYVRHLPGWYAQKHPDEDFAESFAVWLTPNSDWRRAYRDWECLPKLEYVERVMQSLASRPPAQVAADYATAEEWLNASLEEHYRRMRGRAVEVPPFLDGALRDVFDHPAPPGVERPPAVDFIRAHRREILANLTYWTGLNESAVRSLLAHVEERAAALRLPGPVDQTAGLIETTVLLTALCMNKLHKGDFVSRGRQAKET